MKKNHASCGYILLITGLKIHHEWYVTITTLRNRYKQENNVLELQMFLALNIQFLNIPQTMVNDIDLEKTLDLARYIFQFNSNTRKYHLFKTLELVVVCEQVEMLYRT